ncbi:hypothetical protein CDD81_867 [Ophiocordyceps australis]|uniref:RING-type domain-containing protein n=1 Tax=Ophiocordyceps australis TaxID=1399860 RepID=A0A2C5XBC3_9HYPO|nr:hypothetical protein CDD81_867 [Ophiocordyceps australis]
MAPQDSFFEEEEELCPLCIEEFDLSDRNFRPCPCGYQVCQFCFNNIKNNMNGLCPACRRPYDEKTIQWKVVTQEEVAEFRANIQKNQKKRAQEQRQKEAQKREAEKENRKNLIGVRVVQKNLVYVTGLAPTIREDELLKTLRKPEFFGQYGNIQKISISNRKSSDGQHHSLGIYVTFEKPEEATRCIQAVHGSQNGDRILKAQHGTTKYCSAWLKNEKCNNPGCMFLHEQGDEEDSYTRQDLSSMNSIHTQRPLPSGGTSSRAASRQQASQPTPPPPMSQPMARSSSKEGSETGVDASALPSSASWARNPQRSRRGSQATSGTISSPTISTSQPATGDGAPSQNAEDSVISPTARNAQVTEPMPYMSWFKPTDVTTEDMIKALTGWELPLRGKTVDETGPPMWDTYGGVRRRAMKREEAELRAREMEERREAHAASEPEPEARGGSLALGGEPEERDVSSEGHGFDQRQTNTQPPIQRGSTDGNMFGSASLGASSSFSQSSTIAGSMGRAMTPQHFASLRSQTSFADQMPPGFTGQSNMLQQAPGHNRQSSRFNFANDNASSAATNIKLAANPRIMAQQSSMMPSAFQSQSSSQYYGSSMPGPPPGLKSTGTPPSMFGQTFGGFGTVPKDSSSDLLQSLMGRNRAGGSQGLEAGKLDLADPSILQARMQAQSQSNAGAGQGLFGGQSQAADDELPSLAEASDSVDALVSDEPQGVFLQHTAQPQPLGPPGIVAPHANMEPARQARPSNVNVVPVLPKVGPPGLEHGAITPLATPRKPLAHANTSASTDPIKAPLSNQHRPAPSRQLSLLDDEDFPALNAPKHVAHQTTAPAVSSVPTPRGTPAPKKQATTDRFPVPEKIAEPGGEKANIAPDAGPSRGAKNKTSVSGSQSFKLAAINTTGIKTEDMTRNDASAATTPVTRTDSPVTRAAPRSIRVLPLSKADAAAMPSPAPSAASKAVSASHGPETPASEVVSDTASLVSASASVSRAGSPPLGKIGSAAVRPTTKSQQRKQRKEAARQETKIISEAPKAEPEEHAPLIGRKKKQKKQKAAKSPVQETASTQGAAKEEKQAEAESLAEAKAQPSQGPDDETEKEECKGKMAKGESHKKASKAKSTERDTKQPTRRRSNEAMTTQPDKAAQEEKPQPAVSSIFADIRNGLWTKVWDKLFLTKPVSASSLRPEHSNASGPSQGGVCGTPGAPMKPGYCKDCACKCSEIHEEDLATLAAGKAVRKRLHADGSRMLITPNGDCIRGLTEEEEEAFLVLQAAIASTAEHPAAYVALRHQSGNGAFSLIKGRAVPNGRPNIFPTSCQPQAQDPIGKLQREDALSYINQYVLPRLNLGGSSSGGVGGASTTSGGAKLSPTMARDSTAANFNSLAPYFYGPDAAAGVGIYSTAEATQGSQDYSSSPTLSLSVAGAPGAGDESSRLLGGLGGSGGMPLLSVEDAEGALSAARKETEKLEKGLNAVIRRNRRLLLGGNH